MPAENLEKKIRVLLFRFWTCHACVFPDIVNNANWVDLKFVQKIWRSLSAVCSHWQRLIFVSLFVVPSNMWHIRSINKYIDLGRCFALQCVAYINIYTRERRRQRNKKKTVKSHANLFILKKNCLLNVVLWGTLTKLFTISWNNGFCVVQKYWQGSKMFKGSVGTTYSVVMKQQLFIC